MYWTSPTADIYLSVHKILFLFHVLDKVLPYNCTCNIFLAHFNPGHELLQTIRFNNFQVLTTPVLGDETVKNLCIRDHQPLKPHHEPQTPTTQLCEFVTVSSPPALAQIRQRNAVARHLTRLTRPLFAILHGRWTDLTPQGTVTKWDFFVIRMIFQRLHLYSCQL